MEITEQKMEGEAPLPSCQVPGQGATEGTDTFKPASLNRMREACGAGNCSKLVAPGSTVRQSSSELTRATHPPPTASTVIRHQGMQIFFCSSIFRFSHFCMITLDNDTYLPKACASINKGRKDTHD